MNLTPTGNQGAAGDAAETGSGGDNRSEVAPECALGTRKRRPGAATEAVSAASGPGRPRENPAKQALHGNPGSKVSPIKSESGRETIRAERVRATARQSRAPATLANYARAWRQYAAWCAHEGRVALDADPQGAAATVAEYLRDRADGGLKWNTLGLDLAGITFRYQDAGLPRPSQHPGLKRFTEGLRRELGRATESKAPVTDAELRAMLATLPATIHGARDRALLLVGFVGAFRRSELVALDVEDVIEERQGLVITLRRSKSDQEGLGQRKAIPYGADATTCPVRALRAWLDAAAIIEGPVFRALDRHGNVSVVRTDGLTVARVVKRTALAAGLDAERFSGHSLRLGFVTTAAQRGCSERAIANQTGHRSMTVLRGYIRRATVFEENAAVAVL